jgi:hypothetical protein
LLFWGFALTALGFLGFYGDKTERSKGLFDYRIRKPLHLSKDMFPAYMRTLVFSSILISLTGIILMLFSPRWKEEPTIPTVSSLKGALNEFKPYVQEWAPDAMMLSAFVEFGENPWRIVTVYYQSPRNAQEFLRLALRSDGTVEVDVDAFDSAVDPNELFSPSEWSIDSTDAMEIFAENKSILSCMSSNTYKDKELRLERRWKEPSVVQWSLYLECSGMEGYLPINALTGEPVYSE